MNFDQQALLISIRPVYADRIFEGKKRVELRKKFDPALVGSRLLIYSTLPTGAIIGHARISAVHVLPIDEIWERFSEVAMIKKDDFSQYFSGSERGFVVALENVQRFAEPISLREMRSTYAIKPPQSYMFLHEAHMGILQHELS